MRIDFKIGERVSVLPELLFDVPSDTMYVCIVVYVWRGKSVRPH